MTKKTTNALQRRVKDELACSCPVESCDCPRLVEDGAICDLCEKGDHVLA